MCFVLSRHIQILCMAVQLLKVIFDPVYYIHVHNGVLFLISVTGLPCTQMFPSQSAPSNGKSDY